MICNAWAVAATVLVAGILVPIFAIDGAAISRLLGGLVLVAVIAVWSQRVFPVAFPFATILIYFIASAAAAVGIDRFTNGNGFPGTMLALVVWTAVTALLAAVFWFRLRVSECGELGFKEI